VEELIVVASFIWVLHLLWSAVELDAFSLGALIVECSGAGRRLFHWVLQWLWWFDCIDDQCGGARR